MAKSKGLGDDIAKLTSAVRLDKLAETIANKLGKDDCGCSERQENDIKFTKAEMAKLHKDGEITKKDPDGKEHKYIYTEESLNEAIGFSWLIYTLLGYILFSVVDIADTPAELTFGKGSRSRFLIDKFKKILKNRKVKTIVDKLKTDPEVIDYAKKRKPGWRKMLANKLDAEDKKLLNNIYRTHFNKKEVEESVNEISWAEMKKIDGIHQQIKKHIEVNHKDSIDYKRDRWMKGYSDLVGHGGKGLNKKNLKNIAKLAKQKNDKTLIKLLSDLSNVSKSP